MKKILFICVSLLFPLTIIAQASGDQIRRSNKQTPITNKPSLRKRQSVSKKLEGYSKSLLKNISVTVNGITFTMIGVQGGEFKAGNDHYDNPVRKIAVSSFYIAETEVSQALWESIMGYNPSKWIHKDYPVGNVSWNECKEFITKLNNVTNMNFRLPTDAEWEFAAKGGNLSQGYDYSGSNNLSDVAWTGYNIETLKSRRLNELGIYDMCTPIKEWCNDIYDPEYYNHLDGTVNPQGASSGELRVLRVTDIKDRSAEFRNKKLSCVAFALLFQSNAHEVSDSIKNNNHKIKIIYSSL